MIWEPNMTTQFPSASLPQSLLFSTSLVPPTTVGSLGSLTVWSPLLRPSSLYLSMAHSPFFPRVSSQMSLYQKVSWMALDRIANSIPRIPSPVFFFTFLTVLIRYIILFAWMGGGVGREWIYVYVWLSPFDVHLKLSQYC